MAASIKLSRDFLRQNFKQDHGLILAGSPNPLWDDILEMIVDKVIRKLANDDEQDLSSENGPVVIDGLNVDKWSAAKVIQFAGNGVGQFGLNVYNYPAFVKLPLANLDDNVPLYLEGSRFPDNEDGSPGARKSWSEWQAVIPQTDTHAYIECNGGGVVEEGRILARLDADGFNVISQKQARKQIADYAATQNP